MKKILPLALALFLTSCSLFNTDNNADDTRYARCKQLKQEMLTLNSSSDELVRTQRLAQIANINRTYHEYGCD